MGVHQQDRPQGAPIRPVVSLAHRVRTLEVGRAGVLMDMLRLRPDGIGLGRGDPDLPTPAHIVAAGRDALARGMTKYTALRGIPELRHAVADKLRRDNAVEVDPETEVAITTGTQEAVFVALCALLNPGDEILLADPYYNSYATMLHYLDATLVAVPTSAPDGFQIDPDEFETRITPKTKVIALLTPNNPTGTVYPRDRLEGVARVAERHGLYVISDELYETLVFDGAPFSIGSMPSMRDRTITINGFSKAYSMTGWRVGYVVGPRAVVDALVTLRHTLTICAPSMSQYAATAALLGPQDCLAERLAIFRRRRDFMMASLADAGVPFVRPDGTFYVFADIRPTGLSSEEFAFALMEREGVFVYPGGYFGARGEGFERISLVVPEAVLGEAVKRIARVFRRPR
ncbi:MAG TPA: pyridoxal phosphate-dependent aminotransferase [Candidatus Dormibacteraeota bacterium]|nr:pyridoxal phosphate-dependent aminotransferase [Candidatus Dormibacteraeota bacterium]